MTARTDTNEITINVRLLPFGSEEWITLQEYTGDESDLDAEIRNHDVRYGDGEYIGYGCYQWHDAESMTRFQVTNMSYYTQEGK